MIAHTSTSAGRMEWVDAAKGIAIGLMVFGHTIGGLLTGGVLSTSGLSPATYQWLYTFHMPSLMLLSGLFLERSAQRNLSTFALARFGTLYFPALLWGGITFAASSVFAAYVNYRPQIAGLVMLLYSPNSAFWFLTTLLYLSLAYALLRKLHLSQGSIVALALALFIFGIHSRQSLAAHFGWWGIFLFLGCWLAPVLFSQQPKASALALLTIVILAAPFTLLFSHSGVGSSLRDLVVSLLGVSMLISLSSLVCKLPWLAHGVVVCGRYSLQIYVIHALAWVASRTIVLRVFHLHNSVLIVLICWAAGLFFPVLIAILAENHRLSWLFRLDLQKLFLSKSRLQTEPAAIASGT